MIVSGKQIPSKAKAFARVAHHQGGTDDGFAAMVSAAAMKIQMDHGNPFCAVNTCALLKCKFSFSFLGQKVCRSGI